jgi:hypothetical protein
MTLSIVCWLCVTMCTLVFHSLSIVCQYLTMYHLLVLCHYVHCCLPQSVSTSQCTVCWFCVTMCTAVFHSLSIVCQYFTVYSLFVPCHYVHSCLLQSVHCLSVPHAVPSVGSVSLCPLLSSTVCPLSVSTSRCTVCWFSALCPLLPSAVCPLSVPHTPFADCHQTAYYPAAVTPHAALE